MSFFKISTARVAIAATALAAIPVMGAAEGFSSGYVTGFGSSTECMNLARSSMEQHFRYYGLEPDTGEASFSIFGFEVPPGQTQVAVICSEDQGRVTATITGYSLPEDGTRLDTINMFLDYMEGQPVGGAPAPAPAPTPAPVPAPTPAPAPGGK